jgi:Flp pilus assembly protein TadD
MPQDAELHARLAHCLEQQGELEEAEKELGRALRLRPEMAALHIQLAQLLVRANRLPEAEHAYRTALQREPRNPVVLNNLALVLLDAGRPVAEARALAQQARDLAPGMPHVADTLAWCHLKGGNAAAAEPLSAEAVRALPEHGAVRFHRGMVLAALGRKTEAADELRAAIASGMTGPDAEQAAAALEALGQP